jgi:hypothetical protein
MPPPGGHRLGLESDVKNIACTAPYNVYRTSLALARGESRDIDKRGAGPLLRWTLYIPRDQHTLRGPKGPWRRSTRRCRWREGARWMQWG